MFLESVIQGRKQATIHCAVTNGCKRTDIMWITLTKCQGLNSDILLEVANYYSDAAQKSDARRGGGLNQCLCLALGVEAGILN
jgi:hypothetical protein